MKKNSPLSSPCSSIAERAGELCDESLFESAPVSYLVLCQRGTICRVNRMATLLLGEDQSTLLGSPFSRFIVAEEQSQWQELFAGTAEIALPQSREWTLLSPGNTLTRTRLDCTVIPSGHLAIIITRPKEVPAPRHNPMESEACFRTFMTHSPVASWIVNEEGYYQYANPTYYKMFQVPCHDLVGQHVSHVYPPEIAAQYLHSNQLAFSADSRIEILHQGVRGDGSDGEFLVIKFPIGHSQKPRLLGGMALDITEQQKTVAQLQRVNHRLEHVTAEQARHLREIAGELTRVEQRERDRLQELLHDNIQPLLVAARLSLCGLHADTSITDCLHITGQACDHISKVLQVARSLSQQLSPPLIREGGLAPALESLCHWVGKNHILDVRLSCHPNIEPDDVATRLLCFNAVRELLMNVVKHAGTGQAELKLEREGHDHLRITVADRGIGFNPDLLTGGTGLSGIRRRLGMLGGSLRIESQPGRGSMAILTAPLHHFPPELFSTRQ